MSHAYKDMKYYAPERPSFIKALLSGNSGSQTTNTSNGGRVPIPERPADDLNGDPESDEEGDEAPQIVVVREGKHVTKAEYERIKSGAPSPPPLSPAEPEASTDNKAVPLPSTSKTDSLIHQSIASTAGPSRKAKRKIIVTEGEEVADEEGDVKKPKLKEVSKKDRRQAQKKKKGLLSFNEG